MKKNRIRDLSRFELEAALKEEGVEPYRSKQVFRWLYKAQASSFDAMTDLPASLRALLNSKFYISDPAVLDLRRSLSDGTTKYLFKLEDGNTVEAVLLPEKERNTICLSSQVGCKFACVFCASAPFGFVRNLSQGEILEEAISIKNANPAANITNVVFMGIGEPMDNYDNVMRAIRVFNDKDAFNIGARKITISTCGVVPGMVKLIKEGLQIELSVSLHSANDAVRSKLLPVNKRYPLKDLMQACRDYIRATKRIITFEYVLIKGVNSSKDDALSLVRLLKGMQCKVNAISYNKIPGSPYEGPSGAEIKIFMNALKSGGINATHRKPKGEDIDAGCGQLRISRMK
ncbi:MAG: 23S rRNA (adenine(2503)-C(2))-methyltransferase RlmN [Candidatus Omnitrophica bacterium]|nr:23S rRNA (adenine(2503)-C(2))-methyltransferase RlmN [Candidatus Omnitrophota bacterium]